MNWKIKDAVLLISQVQNLPTTFESNFEYVLFKESAEISSALKKKFKGKTIIKVGNKPNSGDVLFIPSLRESMDFIQMDKIEKMLSDDKGEEKTS